MPILLKLWNDIFRYHNTCDCHICSKCFFKIVGKPNSYQFFWPNFITFVTISCINYWDQINSWKNLWKLWNGPLAEINQATPLDSMLQHIGRVTIPMLVPRDYLIYLQTTVRTWGEGLVSESIWGIV